MTYNKQKVRKRGDFRRVRDENGWWGGKSAESRRTLNKGVLSPLRKLVSDSAALTPDVLRTGAVPHPFTLVSSEGRTGAEGYSPSAFE